MSHSLADLFVIEARREYTVAGKTLNLVIKTLGEVGERERVQYGRLASRTALREINNKKSPVHALYIKDVENMDREEIISRCKASHREELLREAQREIITVEEDYIPETIIEDAEHQEHLDRVERNTEEQRQEWIRESMEEYTETLNNLDDRELKERVIDIIKSDYVSEAFITSYKDATLYHGIYVDDGGEIKRLFPSVEFLKGLNPEHKNELFAMYVDLDRGTKDPNS